MNAKEQYRQKLHAQLLEWQEKAAKMRALSEQASEEARAAMQGPIAELDEKIDAASRKLLELSNISEESWESVREGFETAWETLRAAVRDAAAKLKG